MSTKIKSRGEWKRNKQLYLMKYVVKNGFEHHVAMVRGQAAGLVAEACENYLGWKTYRHGADS